MTPPKLQDTLQISAPPARVWEVLTSPEWTPKYMYGCKTVSDWKVGGPLSWEGELEGKTLVAVKGNILELQAPSKLTYTVFDPNAGYTDEPWNHLHVTYRLEPREDGTWLEVQQSGFERVQDGEKRYRDATQAGGWSELLGKIKSLAEG